MKWSFSYRNFLRFVLGILLGLVAMLLLAFNALLLWVATGPRSLDNLTPYVQLALEPPDHAYSIDVGEIWLVWDGWRHPVSLQLRRVSVLAKETHVFYTFPEITLGVDVLSLPFGRILPTSLTIIHPDINLLQNEDRSISFGFNAEAPPAPPDAAAPAAGEPGLLPLAAVTTLLLAPDQGGSLSKLHQITILNADITVRNERKKVFFKAGDADIIFRRSPEGLLGQASARISYDNYQSLVSLQFNMNRDGSSIDSEIGVNQLMPGTLAALFTDNSLFEAVKLPVSGRAKMSFDHAGVLQKGSFMVDGGKGSIQSDRLAEIIPVKSLHAEGEVANNGNDVQIKLLTADLNGPMLAVNGDVSLNNGDAAIHGSCLLKNASAADVRLLWPPTVSPQSRQWVTANISEGKVPEAKAEVNIAFGDLAKPVLPKEAISAALTIDDAKIRYLPDHPELTHVKGVVHIDALTLAADIASADFMDATKLSGGQFMIDDLNADNPYIKVHFNAQSTAKNIVRFLGLPRLKHAERLGLHEDTAEGNATGSASLGFNFFAPRDEKGNKTGDVDFTYDIAAELTGITEPGFMKKFDIKGGDGSLHLKNSGLEFKGKGEVNGAAVSEANVKYLFKPDNGFDTFIEVTANAPAESLPKFGYPLPPFIKGTLGVKASTKQGVGAEISEASLDLTHVSIALPQYGWIKPDGEPAALDFKAEKKEGAVTIPSFHIKGKDIEGKGSAALDKELSNFSRIAFDGYRHDGTDLDHFLYETIDGGMRLEAQGKSADITGWMEVRDKQDSGFSFEHFPAVQFKGDLGRLVTGKGKEISGLKGQLDCDMHLCAGANISGKTGDGKPFNFRILHNPNRQRQLSVHAGNAGAFLKAIGLFDGMEGGELSITGNYEDGDSGSVLKGRASINDHVIKDAPILAKILSVASFTGFFDTLQGNGIRFTRLRAPFTLSKDVITLKDAKTHGAALGMTADGTITFPARTLDLQGTIVPSYTINNVLGHVPLVGPILTGGEDQGIIAARYSLKGSVKNPDVTVNPLSMLTPGFLRGMFDIFDGPKKEEEE